MNKLIKIHIFINFQGMSQRPIYSCTFCDRKSYDSTMCGMCFHMIVKNNEWWMTLENQEQLFPFFQIRKKTGIMNIIKTDKAKDIRIRNLQKYVHFMKNVHLDKIIVEYAVFEN